MKTHGEYIDRGVFKFCRTISDVEARWLCERSALGLIGGEAGPYAKPHNKAFVIYAVTTVQAFALYNHDGAMSIYAAPLPAFRAWLKTAGCCDDTEILAALKAVAIAGN